VKTIPNFTINFPNLIIGSASESVADQDVAFTFSTQYAAALTALASARAESARAALLAQGIDAGRIDVAGETRQMDLPDGMQRQRLDAGARIAMLIDPGDMHVVDVKQQAAAGTPHDVGDEFGFAHGRPGEFHIGRRVLQQHAALEAFLHPVLVRAYAVQGDGVASLSR